jgi:hypothetical protein
MVQNVFRLGQEVWSQENTIRHPVMQRARRKPHCTAQNWTVRGRKNVTLAGEIQRYSAMRLLRM